MRNLRQLSNHFIRFFLLGLALTTFSPQTTWSAPGNQGQDKAVRHHGVNVSFATKAAECGTCHKRQYQEWRYAAGADLDNGGAGSYHAISATENMYQVMLNTVGPDMQNYCRGCHEPGNAWAVVDKIANIPEPREENVEEGVNCMTCHFDGMRIVGKDEVRDPIFCATCHNENTGLVDVYEAWSYDYPGDKTCQQCHMESGNHAFPGFHSASFRQKAVSVSAPVFSPAPSAGVQFDIDFSIINDGTGHSVPEDLFRVFRVKVSVLNSFNEQVYSYEKTFYKRNELFGENPAETEIVRSGEEKRISCSNIALGPGLYTLKIELSQDSNRVNALLNVNLPMNSIYKTFVVE